jgi:hypothetical protein
MNNHFYDILNGNPIDDATFNFGIKFTSIAGEDAANAGVKFYYDLDAPTIFVSSKMTEIFVADNALVTPPSTIFNTGSLTPHFIDLYGATANILPLVEDYLVPQNIAHYYNDNSKQKLKTIINPTVASIDNLTDYTATSIKSKTASVIIATPTMRPRNSLYVPV